MSIKRHLKILACIGLALLIFGSIPAALGSTGQAVYTFGQIGDDGNSISQYTLYYVIPPVIQTGVPTNITIYLYITELTGWKIYDNNMRLTVTADTPNEPNAVLNQVFWKNQTTYQGYRWGPFNVTVDLSNSQVGLSPGQRTPISFYGYFLAEEYWADPLSPYIMPVASSMQFTGNYTIAAASPAPPVSHHEATTFAVAAVVVAVLTVVALATSRRGKSGKGPP